MPRSPESKGWKNSTITWPYRFTGMSANCVQVQLAELVKPADVPPGRSSKGQSCGARTQRAYTAPRTVSGHAPQVGCNRRGCAQNNLAACQVQVVAKLCERGQRAALDTSVRA